MDLGNFCVCLAVKDLATSRAFYEKLGFTQVAGEASQHWLVLRNGTTKIGIFQGHLEKNTLAFNPGWSGDGTPLAEFTDVRDLQRTLEARGVALDVRAEPTGAGPAYVVLKDPDGNPILLDQHVPRPAGR
jgi:catechol 2,3-dioxygenase-like lactoylglutathione lyase family enzyme